MGKYRYDESFVPSRPGNLSEDIPGSPQWLRQQDARRSTAFNAYGGNSEDAMRRAAIVQSLLSKAPMPNVPSVPNVAPSRRGEYGRYPTQQNNYQNWTYEELNRALLSGSYTPDQRSAMTRAIISKTSGGNN